MQKKISQLKAVSSVTGSEQIPAVQSGTTKRLNPSQIFNYMKSATWNGSSLVATNAAGEKLYTPITVADYNQTKNHADSAAELSATIQNDITSGAIVQRAAIVQGSKSLASSQTIPTGVTRELTNAWSMPSGGLYFVVIVDVTFSASATGYRDVKLTSGSRTAEARVAASPSGATRMQVMIIATTSVKVEVSHNAGSDLAVTSTATHFGLLQSV